MLGENDSHVVDLRKNKFLPYKKAAFIGCSVLVGLIIIILANKVFTHAEIADFSPQTCLGSWENPEKAQGESESIKNSEIALTEDNSAVLKNKTDQIFCGQFLPDNFSGQGNVVSAGLTLVWRAENLVEAETLFNESLEVIESNENKVDEKIEPVSEDSEKSALWRIPLVSHALAEESEPSSDTPVITQKEEPSSIAPQNPEVPEEKPGEKPESNELDQSSDPVVIPSIIAPLEPVELKEDQGDQSATSIEPVIENQIPLPEYIPPAPDNNFLEVRYSLDGSNWLSVGKVNPLNFQNLTLPLPKLSWAELSKIQISLIGIDTTLEKLPKVYLDGMFIEVNYEIPSIINPENKKPSETGKVITNVILPNGVQVITLPENQDLSPVREGGTYGSNENPSFDLDLDALPAPPSIEAPIPEEDSNNQLDQGGDNHPENPEILNAPVSARPSVQKQLWQLVRDGRGLLDFFKVKKATAQTGEGELLTADNPIAVQIFDPKNKSTNFHPTILTVNNRLRISVAEPERFFRPGKYKMKIWILRNGVVYTTESDFSWGVLAVNSNKSIFSLGDEAELHFGVLDDGGHTICDAEINLTITTPAGLKIFRNTNDGSIERSASCGPNSGGSPIPDYKTSISNLSEIGIYRLNINAQTKNGPRSIEEQFSVENPPRFDVERSAPTRTYPPDKYTVTIKIKANEDFDGIVEEFVPALFEITDSNDFNIRGEKDNSETKVLQWNLDLKSGEGRDLVYEFKGPDISPELFKLGALKLKNNDPDIEVWQESRQWQIASDAVVNTGSLLAYSDTTDVDNVNVRFLTTTSTWSAEATSIDTTAETSQVQHVVVRASPTRNEYLVGNLKDNGRLDITRYNGTSWSSIISIASTTYTQVCNTVFGSCNQSFDIAYEQLSGRAFIVYTKDVARATGAVAESLYYITWDGNVSSTENSFNFCFVAGSCSSLISPGWVRLVPKGEHLTNNRSNEILILNISNAKDIYAGVWDGSSVISTTTITVNAFSASGRPFDGAWETLSGNAVVVFASSSATSTTPFSYKKLVNGVWDTTSTLMPAITASRGIWVVMDGDPQSDRVAVGLTSSSTATMGWPAIWKATGTAAWNLGTGDTSLEDKAAVGVTVAWERFGTGNSTSTALIIYNDDAAADAADFVTWTPGGGFSAVADIASGWTDDGANRKLIPSPNDDEMMRVGVDSDNDLRTHRWDGGAFTTSGLSAELGTRVASSGDSNTVIWENNGFDFAYKPYSPWSLNWRLYSGTSTAGSPSPALAAENTSATISGVAGQVRLRFNMAELGGNSQTDSRKKLQFTSSTTPDASSTIWTDVGNVGSSTIWRYFDCNTGAATCDDGELITGGTLLSSSTVSGWWTTSNNAAANANMDHASTTILELEFSIEANNTESNQIYFFRMYDVGQDSPVYRQQTSWPATPCVDNSVCAYPSIYTSATDTNPNLSATSLNNGNVITLTPNTTTTIVVNFTLTDGSGCSDVFTSGNVTTTVYRSGLSFDCSEDPLNCYRVTTTTNNCAGGASANATATVDIYYFAQPTDTSSSFSGENWIAKVEARDSSSNQTSSTASGVELNTLVAIEIGTSSINYGQVNSNSNTGQKNQIAPIKNAGNATSSALVRGTALNFNANSIVTSSQHFATSTFVFGGVEQQLSGTNSTISGISLPAYQKILNHLGSWSTTTVMPSINAQHSSLAYNGYLYIFGGDTGVPGGVTSTILYGPINSSTGAISSWSNTTNLPAALIRPVLTVYNGRLYLVGGSTSTSPTHTAGVYVTDINSNGTLGFWNASASDDLPNALGNHSIVAKNGYMYVIGGTPVGSTATSTVLYAPIDSSGLIGTWSTTTALPVARKDHTSYERNGNIYVFGGRAPSAVTSSIIYAPINSDGTLGSWVTASTPLPSAYTTFNILSNSKDSFYSLGASGSTSTYAYLSTISGTSFNWATSTPVPIFPNSNFLDRALVTYNGYSYVSGGAYTDGGENYLATSSVFYAPTFNGRSSSDIFWGVEVPAGNPTGTYSGTITFSGSYSP